MEALFSNPNVWLVAFFIFVIRVINMAVDTIRTLTMMRGMRTITFILGVIESVLFVYALGSVVNDMNNPIYILAYSVGFAAGNVIGMVIEKRLAFGYINLTIISSLRGQELAEKLRGQGHAVTEIPARGKDGCVEILECSVQRKFAKTVQDTILECDPSAFITARDIQRIWRGFWRE
jgi:uncharacterized protein YebE (UPF0316 family)